MIRFVANPGHGGKDSGALSPKVNGEILREADVVLDIAHRFRDNMLRLVPEGTVEVLLTRESDTFDELWQIADYANSVSADYFLAIHCNSATVPASGIEIFTSPGNTGADPYAAKVFNGLVDMFPSHKARKDLSDGDSDKEASFAVLTQTFMPAILVETEFIHTEQGYWFFKDENNREKIANAMAVSSLRHAGIPVVEGSNPPEPAAPGRSEQLEIARQQTVKMAKKIIEINS